MGDSTFNSSSSVPPAPSPPPLPPSFSVNSAVESQSGEISVVLMNGRGNLDDDPPVSNDSISDISSSLNGIQANKQLDPRHSSPYSQDSLPVTSETNTGTESPKSKMEPSSRPSRLQRAFSAHSLTLPSLRKSSKSRKTDARNSITGLPTDNSEIPESSDQQNGLLREASLWRLPGMNTLKKKKSNSSENSKPVIPPKPTELGHNLSPHLKSLVNERDLPPLPSLPSGKRELPPIPVTQSSLVDSSKCIDMNIGTNSACSSNENISEHGSGDKVLKTSNTVSPALSASSLSLTSSPFKVHLDNEPATLTVNDLLNLYSQKYPLRFRVLQGYCSETSDVNFSTGDIHDLHSVKQTNAVTIRNEDGITYHLPVDAQMMFGLIFNLSSNSDEGLNGYSFNTISEITSLSTLPKVICATNAVYSSDARIRVEENEVFVVCQVQRSMFKGKKGLKVFSLLSKSAKVLPEECAGAFSTKPSLVRMDLSDILDYVTNPFPSRAVMYPMSNSNTHCQDIPGTQSGVITLVEHSKESALVVSAVVDPEQEIVQVYVDNSSTFDIPLNDEILDLEVVILKHAQPESETCGDDENDDHVYDDTISVIEKSDPSVALQLSSSMSQSLPDTLNVEMQPETSSSPLIGIKNGPDYVNVPQRHSIAWYEEEENKDASSKYKYSDEEAGYDTVGLHLIQNLTDHETAASANETSTYDQVHGSRKNSESPVNNSWLEDLQSTTLALERRLNTIEGSQQPSEMNRMHMMLEQLTKRLESVDSQLHSIATPPSPISNSVEVAKSSENVSVAREELPNEEANRMYLSSLSVEKICELLDAMDLSQYKEKFSKEQISGEILIECDEGVLQSELGITSKIHRIRLMKLLTGQHSAESLLNKHKLT